MFTRLMIGKIMNTQFKRIKTDKFKLSIMIKYLEGISDKNYAWVFK